MPDSSSSPSAARAPLCRFCSTPLQHSFVDLGMSPLANSYLRAEQLNQMEPHYPLHALVCSGCYLVQLEEFESPQNIFTDYAYFSSFSKSWLAHAREHVERSAERFQLGAESFVIEIASNDGYLLQYFQQKKIPILGIEPAQNVAEAARKKTFQPFRSFSGWRRPVSCKPAASRRISSLRITSWRTSRP